MGSKPIWLRAHLYELQRGSGFAAREKASVANPHFLKFRLRFIVGRFGLYLFEIEIRDSSPFVLGNARFFDQMHGLDQSGESA